ncbi:MAG TPA: ABC transporter permease [Acidimicrobiales bacterium]|nr:ABC transporter permease [Acidimicrobiales bacterium]
MSRVFLNDAAIAVRQLRFEQKAFWRNPAGAVFTLAFPLLFLVIFSTLNSGMRIEERGNISFVTFFVPGIVAFGLVSACYTNLAIRMTISRDFGILKRVRGTPVPTWAYLAGQVASSVVVTFVLSFLTVGLGVVAFGVEFRTGTAAGLFATLALGAACFCALGLAVSGMCPNADAAPAIVNFSIFPLLFVSGIFFPLDNAPAWLTSVGMVFPMQQLADGLQYAFDPRTTGLGFNARDLWSLLAWTVVGSVLAVRLFRWDPVKK